MPPDTAALGALLLTVTLLGGYASARLHGACREASRELREGERRIEPEQPAGGDRRLDDELRWITEVASAPRDARWRESAAVMALLCAAAVLIGCWALTDRRRGLDVLVTVVLVLAAVVVTLLLVVDGRRAGATLAAAVGRSPLWELRRLEDALAAVHRATGRERSAHRAWLRALATDQPLAGVLARLRAGTYSRARTRRLRAVERLRRRAADTHLERLASARVRLPAGYLDGLRGLLPLVRTDRVPDDETWAAALADLGRAAELDGARRTRWLSALAGCAELRDDPPARESAGRWALDAAASAHLDQPAIAAGPRTDPLPDVVAVEPRRPETWSGALHRARTTLAPAWLVADVIVRWAYALVAAAPAGSRPAAALAPAVHAAVEAMTELDPDVFLPPVRAGLEQLGADSTQMGRLVPPRRPVRAAAPVTE